MHGDTGVQAWKLMREQGEMGISTSRCVRHRASKCLLRMAVRQLSQASHSRLHDMCLTPAYAAVELLLSVGFDPPCDPTRPQVVHLMPTRSAPISLVTASTTSSTTLQRFASLPPYSSVRLLELSLMNSSSTSASQSRGSTPEQQQAHSRHTYMLPGLTEQQQGNRWQAGSSLTG